MIDVYPVVQIGVGLLVTVTIILLALRRGRTSPQAQPTVHDFAVMHRTATVPEVGLSFAATMVSALVFIGLPGLFYTHGIGSWLYFCLPVIFGVSALSWFGSRISVLARRYDALSPFDVMNRVYRSNWNWCSVVRHYVYFRGSCSCDAVGRNWSPFAAGRCAIRAFGIGARICIFFVHDICWHAWATCVPTSIRAS